MRRGSDARSNPALRSATGALALVLLLVTAGCSRSESPVARSPAEKPVEAWRTWVVAAAAQTTVPPPPAVGSAAATQDAAALRRLVHRQPAGAATAIRRFGTPAVGAWVELNLELVSRRKVVDPPFASRSYALVSAAMYDAVVASSFWKRRYDRAPPRIAGASGPAGGAPSYPSEHAAIAGAASRVLAYLFRGGRPRALDRVAERAAWSRVWAGTNYPSDVRAGLALGRSIAARVIARAESDGVMRIWSGRRPQRAGVWEPPPGSSTQPVEPLAGTWRTWALRSGSQFRAPPPPAYGSPKFLAEARELIELRRHLTPAQKRTAKFWEGGVGTPLPPGVWNEVALAYVRRDRLDTPHAARVLAVLNIAMADAGVAIWETKYHYWSPRPENAIRSLGLDRRWTPFLATPPFPAYVSAHSAYSAAASEVLSRLFPRDVARFQTKAREAGLSRLYGGIHFRSDHVAGVDLGRNVARLVLRRAGLTAAAR